MIVGGVSLRFDKVAASKQLLKALMYVILK